MAPVTCGRKTLCGCSRLSRTFAASAKEAMVIEDVKFTNDVAEIDATNRAV